MEFEKSDFYKLFFQEANEAILMVDASNWKLLAANKFAKKLLAITEDDVEKISFPQFRRIIKLAKKENSPSVFSELTLDSPEVGEILVDIFARIVELNGRQIIIASIKNVSDQYLMSEKLVQADKLVLLGQLSASLVHEIRNPLAAVNLNLQLLSRALSENKELLSYVNTALQGVERISKIIDVTLSFSRQSEPFIEKLNLNTVVVSTLDLINHLLRKKEITLSFDLKNDLPLISADSKHLQQIIVNLITNAIDAIEKKGTITLKTYVEDYPENNLKLVCLTVEDDGVGIAEEDLDKIFNPFFTKKPSGTGLGLAITQKLLYKYNGTIEVQSRLGEGTAITIKFPQS
jgi:two-component system NtrC family sensor kinase